MKNKMLSALAILLLTLALTMPLAYAGNTSSGTATVGNQTPTVTNPGLWNSAGTSNLNNTNLIVNTEYRINCTVTDNNQLYDVENVTFTIWEDTYADVGSADSNVNHYRFRYLNDTDTWIEVGPDAAGDSHLVLANCADPADHTATSGTFKLAWKLHKTGNYTATKTWKINIEALDSASQTGSVQTLIFGVSFYEEVTVVDTTHAWTGLSGGNTNVVITSPADHKIDITVTANANFDVQAKGSGALTSGSDTIGLGNVTIHENTVGSSAPLTTDYADVGGLTSEASGEDQPKSFQLWIDVPAGQASGEYTYTLSVQIVKA